MNGRSIKEATVGFRYVRHANVYTQGAKAGEINKSIVRITGRLYGP
jgi:hypothetical protein